VETTHVPEALREYALLADGERGIVLGPCGDLVWMCFPSWESDAVFSTLIGGTGMYAVAPTEPFVWGGSYEPGTLIWRSRWATVENAIIESREALALPSRPDRAVVLRRVIARKGDARVQVTLHPRGRFGAEPVSRLRRDDAGVWHGSMGDVGFSWSGAGELEPQPDGHRGKLLTFELELEEGARHDLVLVLSTDGDEAEPVDAETAWSMTEAGWRERVPRFEQTVAPRDARHAYAVLSGLTCGSGGMVAAATMSLPERAREGRNYDYRYVWIRDQCFAGQAVAAAGALPLLDDAVRFVSARLLDDGPDLKPAYTHGGGAVPGEHSLGLLGYPGGSDIAGNRANRQFQLDAFGEALLLFSSAAQHDHLTDDDWQAAKTAAAAIEARWQEPDAGIWELELDAWTHSRLICAAGLRSISAAAPPGGDAGRWLALADAITADTAAHAIHPSGRWQRSPTDERVDVSLLLPVIQGGLAPDDPRSLATLRAIEDELTVDGYAYRFRPDERPLGEAEGAFLLCGFIMSLAYGQQGDTVAAARWFERNRAACGPPGLLSEEFDVKQRQLRGNLPQAFVHALILECAARQHDVAG
jgi:GH15 family glucan-1,4-alpha-glucosidase